MSTHESTKPNPVCHIRQIKTGQMVYDYQRKTKYPPQAKVPWLQLKGHWLEKAGFEINTPVTVRVMEGCLVLTADS